LCVDAVPARLVPGVLTWFSGVDGWFCIGASAFGGSMGTITTTDGTEIFYKDWGSGQPIVFSHGWPLSSEDWDVQMMFFLQQGYRVIAHDRRGHGRSTQTSDGHRHGSLRRGPGGAKHHPSFEWACSYTVSPPLMERHSRWSGGWR
jgi:pimeloyl-ACP methyl ester carboxylesterase